MKTTLIVILAILLSGCSTVHSMRSVDIDGETVRIKYRPQ